ncbi:MAG: HlyD family efflux transporter periplasmic adaptor subunit [Pseudomonadota bacterium]
MSRIAVTSFMLAVVLAGQGCSRTDAPPPMVGTLERHRLELAAYAAEPVLQLPVREGQQVAAGDIIAQLDPAIPQARRDAAAAAASQARQKLQELVQGPRVEEILESRARLEAAEADALLTNREFEREQNLLATNAVSKSSFDTQRSRRDQAAAVVKQSRAALTVLLKGTRLEQLDQARSALQQAEAQLQTTATELSRLTLRAPQAATVEALPYRVGERPAAGATVAVLIAADRSYARVYVPESLRARLKPGSVVDVRVDGVAEVLRGELRFMASEASFTPYYALTQRDRGRLTWLAEIDLPDSAAQLPVGTPLEAHLPGEQSR